MDSMKIQSSPAQAEVANFECSNDPHNDGWFQDEYCSSFLDGFNVNMDVDIDKMTIYFADDDISMDQTWQKAPIIDQNSNIVVLSNEDFLSIDHDYSMPSSNRFNDSSCPNFNDPLWGSRSLNEVPESDIRAVEEIIVDLETVQSSQTKPESNDVPIETVERIADVSSDVQYIDEVDVSEQRPATLTSKNQIRRSRRGRPKISPECHLAKLPSAASPEEKKLLCNNAASCKYRHKKSDDRRKLEEEEIFETNRYSALKAKHKKLAKDIKKLENKLVKTRVPLSQ